MNDALQDLYEQVRQMPTIMPISQEIQVLQHLHKIDVSILASNEDALKDILSIIEESHSGGAIFEANDINYSELVTAAQWLEEIATSSLSKNLTEFVLNVAQTLRARF